MLSMEFNFWRMMQRRRRGDLRAAVIAALFGDGEQGAFYDPSDLSTLYQDSAGTTPVTADGQPVGRMLDLSGNGNHATQATTGAKPLYKTDGTLHWIEGDGFDDFMTQGSQTLGNTSSHIVAVEKFDAGNDLVRILGGSSNFSVRWDGANVLQAAIGNFTVGSGRVILSSVTGAGPQVLAFRRSSVANSARLDALATSQSGSTTHDVTGSTETKYLFASGATGSTNVTRCKFYGSAEVFDTFIDDTKLALVDDFLKQRSGI